MSKNRNHGKHRLTKADFESFMLGYFLSEGVECQCDDGFGVRIKISEGLDVSVKFEFDEQLDTLTVYACHGDLKIASSQSADALLYCNEWNQGSHSGCASLAVEQGVFILALEFPGISANYFNPHELGFGAWIYLHVYINCRLFFEEACEKFG